MTVATWTGFVSSSGLAVGDWVSSNHRQRLNFRAVGQAVAPSTLSGFFYWAIAMRSSVAVLFLRRNYF